MFNLNDLFFAASHDVVFINFYADWCRFSNMLEPIWNEAADKLKEELGPELSGKAMFGKVDSDKEGNLARRYHISKYPTLKLIKFGALAKREYRGQRSVEAFVTYIKEQVQDPIKQFHTLDELKELEQKKRKIIGYYRSNTSPTYAEFKKLSMHLKDDCEFHVTFE
jgi:endoplasmic reticulum resident protein 44